MSNTRHLPFLVAFIIGCFLGPLIHNFTQDWSLVLAGLISGTIAYLSRHIISSKS